MASTSKQSVSSKVIAQGNDWRLCRLESRREPLLGAVVTTGPWHQRRVFESGGGVIAIDSAAKLLGAGHSCHIAPDTTFLYLPIARTQPTVEWVFFWAGGEIPDDAPEMVCRPASASPVDIPLNSPNHVIHLYPKRLRPWLGFPPDVQSWANKLEILATSLTQRTQRLVGESPKRILSALRATIAFELAFDYQGRGASLALETGYSSQSHLARDIQDRFGMSLSRLMAGESSPQLDWLKLTRCIVR